MYSVDSELGLRRASTRLAWLLAEPSDTRRPRPRQRRQRRRLTRTVTTSQGGYLGYR